MLRSLTGSRWKGVWSTCWRAAFVVMVRWPPPPPPDQSGSSTAAGSRLQKLETEFSSKERIWKTQTRTSNSTETIRWIQSEIRIKTFQIHRYKVKGDHLCTQRDTHYCTHITLVIIYRPTVWLSENVRTHTYKVWIHAKMTSRPKDLNRDINAE